MNYEWTEAFKFMPESQHSIAIVIVYIAKQLKWQLLIKS